ncbi:hypothetical protein JCM11251_005245 [Rhodosporidiobolus azoricus]
MQRPFVLLRSTLRTSPSSSSSSILPSLSRTSPYTVRLASYTSANPSTSSPRSTDPHPYLSQFDATGATAPSGPSSAGPFPLPDAAAARARAARIEGASKKWAQLGTAQKAGVVATQGASFFVVLAGAGLFVLVAYAVGTELFSEASPTRVFEDCVDRVRADEELTSILAPPLTFHGSASGTRARHRRISHSYSVDPTSGTETLFVRFWVEARDPHAEDEGGLQSWMDWAKRWIGPAIWEDSNNPGSYQPHLDSERREREDRALEEARRAEEERKRRKTWGGWLASGVESLWTGAVGGAFGGKSGFRGTRADGEEGASGGGLFRRQRKPRLGEFTTGEVVAELEKDRQTGHFVYKQLFVAIPDTHHPSYYRHNISTATVIPPEGEQTGLNRLRFWSRTKVA